MFSLIPFSRKGSGVSRKDDFFGLDRFFSDFFRDPFFSRVASIATPIRADVKENDNEYILEAECRVFARKIYPLKFRMMS